MSKIPASLTEAQKALLRKLLPMVVTRFVHDGEHHVSDLKTFFEIWFEMPGMKEHYASTGFTTEPGPMYWTVPRAPATRLEGYNAKGYGDEYKQFLWRYVAIPAEFWRRPEAQQVSWLIQCIEELLKEDEQLRGM